MAAGASRGGRRDRTRAKKKAPVAALTRMTNWWTQQKLKCRIPRIRLKTVEKLARRGGQHAVKSWAQRITDPALDVRKAVVQALSGRQDKLAVAALVSALRDPAIEVRWRAAKSLEASGWQPASDEQSAWRAVAK